MVAAGWSLLDSSLAGSARPGRVDAREDHAGAGRALLNLPAAGMETGWGAGGSAPARPGACRAPQGCTSVSGPPPGLSLSVRPDVCVRFPGPPPCQPTEPALGLGRPRLPSWGCGVANPPPPRFPPGQLRLAAGSTPHRVRVLRGPAWGSQGGRVLGAVQEGRRAVIVCAHGAALQP